MSMWSHWADVNGIDISIVKDTNMIRLWVEDQDQVIFMNHNKAESLALQLLALVKTHNGS